MILTVFNFHNHFCFKILLILDNHIMNIHHFLYIVHLLSFPQIQDWQEQMVFPEIEVLSRLKNN